MICYVACPEWLAVTWRASATKPRTVKSRSATAGGKRAASRSWLVLRTSTVTFLSAGRVDGIVVATRDRLSRQSTIDALTRVPEIQDAGGTVASVRGEVPVDPTTPAGEFQLTLFAAIARRPCSRNL
jgi:hypothetical protein